MLRREDGSPELQTLSSLSLGHGLGVGSVLATKELWAVEQSLIYSQQSCRHDWQAPEPAKGFYQASPKHTGEEKLTNTFQKMSLPRD